MANELTIYQSVIDDVKGIISSGMESAYNATSRAMVLTYWNVGRRIVEQEQNGNQRAEYGTAMMDALAAELTKEYGKSYSKRNLQYFRKFYQCFPDIEIVNSCVHNLTWTHFRSLLRVPDEDARVWYMSEAAHENWNVRTLDRNISTQYYYRLLQSPKKEAVIAEMQRKTSQFSKTQFELVKSPVVAEFLGFKNEDSYLESDLESAILSHIRDFLMEMGRGFAFVARQQHIITETEDYFIDLVFYNIELKCYVLVDLKMGKITHTIQTDHVKVLRRDDGTSKNIQLIDKKNIHNNRLQVINQYEETGGSHDTRYDVTILVNGLPLVHVELKRRGVAIREAFNQIKRYQRDSFWAASGLYEYVQIFIISNGTHTKYYSNTTRNSHIKEMGESAKQKSKKTSNSFEFTSFWADGNNKVIADLIDFTKTFLAKHTILNVLTKYCVFTSEEILMVMRPYQIAATERILNRIEVSTNYKKMGTLDAGGYIWHTTGSGKTLTSFKAAQLASALPYVDKVLFVVDRKDLDYQTMKEYDRFEKGSANSNASTRVLQRQLEDRDEKGGFHPYKIIITTIQKLDNFVTKNKGHEVFNKHYNAAFNTNFGKRIWFLG